ncbi:MAG: hypothetical protein RI947_1348 [Candidatus Parcubacteria bacterium]|jgi:hypothetical protein
MDKQYISLCSRCGSERIIFKQWTETVGMSEIVCTQKICPNTECQSLVDKDIKQQKEKKDALERKRNERLVAKKKEHDAMMVELKKERKGAAAR